MFVRFLSVLSIVLALSSPALAQAAPATTQFNDAQKQEIQAIVKEYLIANPAVIGDAIKALQTQMQQEQTEKSEASLRTNIDKLRATAGLPIAGNPQGDVTIVEFFDYNCGYCKAVYADISKLLESDKGIRFIHREFPILSAVSVTAAKAALAANLQGKYLEMHSAMMAAPGHLSEDDIFKLAATLGLDVAKLRTDMESPAILAEITSNRSLADSIGVRGTPAFIIGTSLYPGALDLQGMKDAVTRTRAQQSPTAPQ